jgi:hypothetical protein
VSTPSPLPTLEAVARGRLALDAYVCQSTAQDHTWNEESATERLIMAAHPEVKYATFSRAQEAAIGADWLWWFVGDSGECFGVLVQAKKLTVGARTFAVDYKHPGGPAAGKQLADLLAAANVFEVPAAYAVYCGDPAYRGGDRMCPAADRGDPCQRCERASVLIFPALAAQELLGDAPSKAGAVTFERGVPLEDAIDPAVPGAAVEDVYRLVMGAEFAALLEDPQTGPREIAKRMFEMVKEVRGQMALKFHKDRVDLGPDAVIRSVFAGGERIGDPLLPYAHILRGLRHRLPGYVTQVLAGGQLPDEYAPYLAGLAVIRL